MSQKIFLTLSVLAIFLVAADLVGVGICFVGACGFLNGWTKAAAYTLWFVFGVFGGAFQYFTVEGDKLSPEATTSRCPTSKASFLLSFLLTAAALGVLTWIFYLTGWQRGVDSEDCYVPDSMSATLTFFISILAMMLFLFCVGMPAATSFKKEPAANEAVPAGGARNRPPATRKTPSPHRKLP